LTPFRWGIIGPGRIARKFATSLPYSRNGKLVAVASTDANRARDFALEFDVDSYFTSYAEMLKTASLDAVYIANPHPFHFQAAVLALESKVPVLCEKPLTDSLQKTRELIEIANRNQVFLMEGMWSWFLPHIQQTKAWIDSGEIGEVIHIQADFGFKAHRDLEGRLFNPGLGGGVAKDIAIYPLSFLYKLIGDLQNVQVQGSRASETGVDEHIIFQGRGSSGATFQSLISFLADTETKATVYGRQGRIELSGQWFRAVSATLIKGEKAVSISCPAEGFGFQFEADEVEKQVKMGASESSQWRLCDSLYMAEWIENLEKNV
jgi:predicted dehydrogenase